MASLCSGMKYGLAPLNKISDDRDVILLKLTDSALRAIEEYIKNLERWGHENPSGATIKFLGNGGELCFPSNQNGKINFTFSIQSTSDFEGQGGSFECLKHVSEMQKNSLYILGSIPYKLRVNANDDIYEATRHRMTIAEENQKNKCTREIKLNQKDIGRKVQRINKKPPIRRPNSMGFNSHTVSIKESIHDDSQESGGNSLNLDLYTSQHNKSTFGTESTQKSISRSPCNNRTNSPPSSVSAEHLTGKRSNNFQSDDASSANGKVNPKRQRVSPLMKPYSEPTAALNVRSSHMNESQRVNLTYESVNPSSSTIGDVSRRKAHVSNVESEPNGSMNCLKRPNRNMNDGNHHQNLDYDITNVNDKKWNSDLNNDGAKFGLGNIDVVCADSNTTAPRSNGCMDSLRIPSTNFTSKSPIGNGAFGSYPPNNSNAYELDQNPHSPLLSISPAFSMPTTTHNTHNGPISDGSLKDADSEDYLRQYTRILNVEQRRAYKSDFNAHYAEYKKLHAVVEKVSTRFTKLEEQLKQSNPSSSYYKDIQQQILKEYQDISADTDHQYAKRRFQYLHNKLSHIKKLVCEYDENATNFSHRS